MSRWRRAFRLAIRSLGPLLLGLILWRLHDAPALLDTLAAADGWGLLAAVALGAVPLHAKLWRWRILLGTGLGRPYATGRAYRAFLPSLYLGMVTPGRVGDVLRVQYLRHDLELPYAEGLAVSVLDRLCDVYVLLAFVVAGVAHFATVITGRLAQVTWGGMALVAVAPALLLVPGLVEGMGRRLWKPNAGADSKDEASGVERFVGALRRVMRAGRAMLPALLLTAVAFLANYVQAFLVAGALGLELSFLDVVSLLAISSLLSLLPISISGVGVREGFYALVFPSLGLPAAAGVAFGLGVLATLYLPLVVAGFVAWQVAPPPVEATSRLA